MIKRLIATTVWLGLLAPMALAQPDPENLSNNPRVAQYRIAIFSDVLQLTPEEAQSFWPLYNQYLGKREELRKSKRPGKPLDNMTDQEIEEQIKRHFEVQAGEIDLEKKLVEDLRKVLPVRKIAKLPVAEQQFRASLLKKLQEARAKRMERGGMGNGN